MKAIHLIVSLGLLATAACDGRKDAPPAADAQAGMAMDSPGMAGMPGMGSSQSMPMMQAHTDSMTRMTPEQMAAHQRMMSQMMDQMGGEMQQMKMSETPEWTALTDSVKRDLADLTGLKGETLSARMRAHSGRVQRLITAHEGMMKAMRSE